MRSRMPVLASACVAAAAVAVPSVAGAAPIHDRALSIHVTSSHVVSGSPLTIYGRLVGPHNGDRQITLYHRINPATQFTVISRTHTNDAGQYDFPRADGVVNTNRSWFVRGPERTHSQTIHESVAAEVTISASATSGTTRHPLTFSGQVTPGQTGSRVALQVENAAGTSWHTVKVARVTQGSNYTIAYAFRTPNSYNVRAAFLGDGRNTPAASDPTSVIVNQRQAPYFTISTSAAIVPSNTLTTISGTLDQSNTSTPEVNTDVGLYAHVPGSGTYTLAQSATTDASGDYSFSTQSDTNELYQVRTINASPAQATAQLFQGVQDTVMMATSAASSSVGSTVTFTGSVAPPKAGHSVFLEKLGADGHWQIVETSTISSTSTFSFNWTFGSQGTKQFRARVVGGSVNVGGASAPITETVALPAVSQLPGN